MGFGREDLLGKALSPGGKVSRCQAGPLESTLVFVFYGRSSSNTTALFFVNIRQILRLSEDLQAFCMSKWVGWIWCLLTKNNALLKSDPGRTCCRERV